MKKTMTSLPRLRSSLRGRGLLVRGGSEILAMGWVSYFVYTFPINTFLRVIVHYLATVLYS